jgi:hypothetical protein
MPRIAPFVVEESKGETVHISMSTLQIVDVESQLVQQSLPAGCSGQWFTAVNAWSLPWWLVWPTEVRDMCELAAEPIRAINGCRMPHRFSSGS